VIQQHQIEWALRQQFERLPDAGAVLDFEKGFLCQNARNALPEKSMIVHQERPDR
jgi:hypothetical protein